MYIICNHHSSFFMSYVGKMLREIFYEHGKIRFLGLSHISVISVKWDDHIIYQPD